MPITVSCDGLTVVTTKSDGKAMCTIPDICKTPMPPTVCQLPLPYPNMVESKDLTGGSVMTKIDGGSAALLGSYIPESKGDEAGVMGGLISGCNKDMAMFLNFSPTVKIECRPVVRKSDMMIMNKINTIGLAGMDQPDLGEPEDPREVELEPFKVQLKDGNDPRSGVPFKIVARGMKIEGSTDSSGMIDIEIPKGVTSLNILVDNKELIKFKMGDPPTGKMGDQVMLSNLGLYSGKVDGTIGERTKAATIGFQLQSDLKIDGELGSKTKNELLNRSKK